MEEEKEYLIEITQVTIAENIINAKNQEEAQEKAQEIWNAGAVEVHQRLDDDNTTIIAILDSDEEITPKQTDFLKRLKAFMLWDCEKGELNDRANIKEQLLQEFEEVV